MNESITENSRIKRSILIIEDNELNREMLKSILEDHYNVIEAENGKDGLEKLHNNFRTLSLVLLDVQMPVMNGYEFLEKYRADGLLSSVPVIVTTGSSVSEDEEKCLALGASDFVTKPYNPKIIIRRIEAIIRLHESIAALQAVEYDSLTGLYTKSAFAHHAENEIRYSEDSGYDMALINVEDFSYINERYGEMAGNELLHHIGRTIITSAKGVMLSCRYSADRFVILAKHGEYEKSNQIEYFDKQAHTSSPIEDFVLKFALYENIDKALSVNVLCDRLVLAVESIKHQYNKKIAYYDKKMSERINRLRKIEDYMEAALTEEQFKIYYQPKHDVKTGKLAGAEALVRWTHPVYGFFSPGDFIPLFEENGFITSLDLYTWRAVCRDLEKWSGEGIPLVPVSVNASRRDFVAIDSYDKVLAPIGEYGIDKKYLHIEITESASISDELFLHKIKKLRELGIKIELDDFGSGQSSLGTIGDIPMDVIKLDSGFAKSLVKQKEIVRMIISLAHALGCKTVVEGVESADQIELLKELGCDMVQGYYYSKPISSEQFEEYLKNHAQIAEE